MSRRSAAMPLHASLALCCFGETDATNITGFDGGSGQGCGLRDVAWFSPHVTFLFMLAHMYELHLNI
jgi:hypothetical protein